MCTCIIVGKGASATGTVLFGANDDWDGVEGVLTHVTAKHHEAGATYTLVGGREIPELPETLGYSYTACLYSIGNLDRGWAGGMNDRGVAVAGTGVDAYKPLEWKGQDFWLEPDDIPLLILRRARTAREGVRIIADLIGEHGLRPSYLEGSVGSSAATFSIADAEEGWVLEVAPGRRFVATRVPDDCISVRVNAFGTHDADLTDEDNTIASPHLAEDARELGFWQGDEQHFDFAAAYGSDTSPTEWGPEQDPMNALRRWRVLTLATEQEADPGTTCTLARPSRPLAKEDVMAMLSDVYEGCAYDLTKTETGEEADPLREDTPVYALCRRSTVASIVADHSEEEEILWVAMGPPRVTEYLPY